jgi:D-alanyl-D-alanine carboxypeptidase/D-alanyl-D-alanine-endopeptidase (penicillin-binding protein 4)
MRNVRTLALCVGLTLFASAALPVTGAAAGAPTDPVPVPVTPILSARRFPGSLEAATADPDLATALDAYLSRVVGNSCAIVEQDGRIVYTHAEKDVLAPASVMKLATAVAALEILGPDRILTTTAVAATAPKDGVVDGNLTIVGGGDPLFTSAGYRAALEDPDQFGEDFTKVADAIAAAGVTRINGDIVGDDSRYEPMRWVPSWPTRYQVGGTVAPLSALLVNDGLTGYADSPNQPTPNRKAGDPPLLFAQTLRTVLKARGIEVTGNASAGPAPSGAHQIASFDSVPMSQIVSEMLTDSDNTTAELLAREIGHEVSGQGTTAAGIAAIPSALQRLGFDTTGLVMNDGSGLDTGDRMPCALAIALVERVASDPQVGPNLPVAGKTGTLRKRMLNTASTGRVRAKTGTLNTVNSLAGFADTPQGNHLTFSFIHNGSDGRGPGVADGFTDRLMAYAKGPRIETLGPLPASR